MPPRSLIGGKTVQRPAAERWVRRGERRAAHRSRLPHARSVPRASYHRRDTGAARTDQDRGIQARLDRCQSATTGACSASSVKHPTGHEHAVDSPRSGVDSASDQRVSALRFAMRTQQTGAQRRCVYFAPEDIVCRIWWERNRYGTTRWQLVILQAKAPHRPSRGS